MICCSVETNTALLFLQFRSSLLCVMKDDFPHFKAFKVIAWIFFFSICLWFSFFWPNGTENTQTLTLLRWGAAPEEFPHCVDSTTFLSVFLLLKFRESDRSSLIAWPVGDDNIKDQSKQKALKTPQADCWAGVPCYMCQRLFKCLHWT